MLNKGYAFADFIDTASVANAIEKLNNVEYKGRKLRVDYAERELSRRGGSLDGIPGRPGPGGGPPGPGPPPLDPVEIHMAPPRVDKQF